MREDQREKHTNSKMFLNKWLCLLVFSTATIATTAATAAAAADGCGGGGDDNGKLYIFQPLNIDLF